jgi:nuclear RNA export factor
MDTDARFFTLFDTQRSSLIDVYHPSCTFSYSANTSVPTRAKIQGFHSSLPNQRRLQWSTWLAGSRNLDRIGGSSDKPVTALRAGAEDTVKTIMNLPVTRHEVQDKAEKFCLDAWPVSMGEAMHLFITVHGEFVECKQRIRALIEPIHQPFVVAAPSEGICSFDRSFVVAPAPEGSRYVQMTFCCLEIPRSILGLLQGEIGRVGCYHPL